MEARIQAACRAGDPAAAATLAIESYGAEILAFLIARLRGRGNAEEVFSMFAEKLWTGLPDFEWRCSVKSWAYRIARNAANDFVTAAQNRPERNLALSGHPSLSALVERVRTATQNYRRTEVKDRVRELRERLAPDDQMLLILRVDQDMAWRDLVVAMGGPDAPLDDAEVDKEAARLRKRFERVKGQLRDLAREAGLL
jgi:RNA polymerase sigma-70 factor (ECF subfamily)